MKKFFFALLLAIGFLQNPNGCFAGDKEDIEFILLKQIAAWNNGNLERFMYGYWASDSLQFVSKKGITHGYANTLAMYQKAYPTKEKMGKLLFSDLQVLPMDSGHAVVIGKWDLVRDGENVGGYFSLLFRKFSFGWRIIVDHTS